MVHDFQVSYFSEHDADLLITAHEKNYELKKDLKGENYIYIDFQWDHNKEEVIFWWKDMSNVH